MVYENDRVWDGVFFRSLVNWLGWEVIMGLCLWF